MTISVEAVMRREAGARGPQMYAGFATGALKFDFSNFKGSACEQSVAIPATNFRGGFHWRFHVVFSSSLRGSGIKGFGFIKSLLMVEPVDLDDT